MLTHLIINQSMQMRIFPSSLLYYCFLLMLFHDLVDSKCVTNSCGNNKTLAIHYPFGLQGKHQKGCDHPAIDLTCSSSSNQTSSPVLNLPSFGDLYVRDINYTSQTVQLHHPCLAGLFVNSNFPSNSSVTAQSYQNYTFFTCPNGSLGSNNFTAIGCLSNSSFSVLATTSILRAQELSKFGCNMSVTVPIPVSSSLQFEYNGFADDLFLTWDIPYCNVCMKKSGVNAGKVVGLVILSLVWPYLSLLAIYILIMAGIKMVKSLYYIICWVMDGIKAIFSRLRRLFSPRTRDSAVQLHVINREGVTRLPRNVTAAAQTSDNNNSNNISSVTRTIVLGESRRIPGPNGTVCPICLEEFKAKETLRSISQCGHSFHTDCIDQWLRSHRTCPVCRNTP